MNLDEMSLRELQELQRNITRLIETYQDRAKRDALSELREKARSMGFTIEELLEFKSSKPTRKSPEPKYRHPENAELTWSGRGKKPRWFVSALNRGVSADDLMIQ